MRERGRQLKALMPRWYYLLVLRAMQLISMAALVVAIIIGLCVAADWLWHLGWGYPWYAVPFLVVYVLIALTVIRITSALMKRFPKQGGRQLKRPWNRSMRVSTAIIIGIGIIPIGLGVYTWAYAVIMKPPSWDIGIPWAVLSIEIGEGIVGVGILKFVLLDRLWGAKF